MPLRYTIGMIVLRWGARNGYRITCRCQDIPHLDLAGTAHEAILWTDHALVSALRPLRHEFECICEAASSLHRTPFGDFRLREHTSTLLSENVLMRRNTQAYLPRHLARLIIDEFSVIGDSEVTWNCLACARSLVRRETVIIGLWSRFTQAIVQLIDVIDDLRLLKMICRMLYDGIYLRQIATAFVIFVLLMTGRGQLAVRFGFEDDGLGEIVIRLSASEFRSLFLWLLGR